MPDCLTVIHFLLSENINPLVGKTRGNSILFSEILKIFHNSSINAFTFLKRDITSQLILKIQIHIYL